MRCPKCGYRNREDEVFCVGCGTDMKAYQRDMAERMPCPACEAMNRIGSGSCSACGAKLDSDYVTCSKCGMRNPPAELLCKNCDSEIAEPAQVPVAPVPPQPEAVHPQESFEPRCPKCSGPMERGLILAPNAGMLGGIRWDTVDGIDFWGLKGEVLVPSPVVGSSIRIPGFRCQSCGVLVLTY
jgi:hypothetical protein